MDTLKQLLWKNLRWQLHGHYCTLEQLKEFDPKLASAISFYAVTEQDFWDGEYVYHLTKSGHIHRKPDCLKIHGHDEPTEKPRRPQS